MPASNHQAVIENLSVHTKEVSENCFLFQRSQDRLEAVQWILSVLEKGEEVDFETVHDAIVYGR